MLTETLAAEVAKITAGATAKALLEKVFSSGKSASQDTAKPKLDISAYLEATFNKCVKTKTILNRVEPINLLDIYVDLNFIAPNATMLDQYGLIEYLRTKRRVNLYSTGGGGKSSFSKYLWISFFASDSSVIPIFIELRSLNNTENSFIDILADILSDQKAPLSKSTIIDLLRDGKFVFILDGFDELVDRRKALIEQEIMALSNRYEKNIFFVSGRPLLTSGYFESFHNVRVAPLNQKQIESLITKTSLEKNIRERFIDNVLRKQFSSYKSFLETPLLALMMLLTFDQYANIPRKLHIFYDQVFDTLFSKHDAGKAAVFVRETHTGYSIDLFKNKFSSFCLTSYMAEKSEFSKTEYENLLLKSSIIDKINADPQKFLRDLVESVCMIEEVGVSYKFVHRSFQEFFSAVCLSRLSVSNINKIGLQLVKRNGDKTIEMFMDMNPRLFTESIFLPFSKEVALIKEHCLVEKSNNVEFLMFLLEKFNINIEIFLSKNFSVKRTNHTTSDLFYFMEYMRNAWPSEYLNTKEPSFYIKSDANKKGFSFLKNFVQKGSANVTRINISNELIVKIDEIEVKNPELTKNILEAFLKTGHSGYIHNLFFDTVTAYHKNKTIFEEQEKDVSRLFD
jgi:hypothetical protein